MRDSLLIKDFENILKIILLVILLVSPLIHLSSLYYPYVSGKAYFFRLLIGIALFFWLILLFKKPKSRPNFKNWLVLGILILSFVYLLTSFTGVDFKRSLFSTIERSDGVIQYFLWVLYFLMLVSVFKTKKDWQIILSIFIVAALINCFYGFFRHYHYNEQPQLFGFMGNSSYLAAFLIFALGFSLLFLTKFFKPFVGKTPLWFFAIVTSVIFILFFAFVLTQTRGAYAGVFLGFVVFVILSNFYFWKSNKKLIIFLDVLLFLVLISSILIFVFKDSSFIKKYPLISRVAHTFQSTSAQDRLAEWQTAIKGFKDKPIFGWGPENFDVVANKYYNYRVGLYEPWFDRPHNQALQYLVEGGIVLFSAYLFLVAMIFFSIFKIFKKEKTLGSLLFAIYIAYIIQSLILFDTLPIFLGFFVFLGFIYFAISEVNVSSRNQHQLKIKENSIVFYATLFISLVLIIFFEIQSVFKPVKANQLIIESFKANISKDYSKQSNLFDKLFSFRSPYLYPDIRRALGWDFGQKILDKEIQPQDKEAVLKLYHKIIPELENWLKYRPVDQQAYYVLGSFYRLGFEKLGQQEALSKAEAVFKKALNYSKTRVEYIDELAQILLLQKKYDELDTLIKNFAANIDVNDPYRYLSLGHSYFMQGKYDLAMQEYEKARTLGQKFWDNGRDYYRYLKTAEELKDYQKVKEMTEAYLKNIGEDADTLFNLSVAQLYLGDKANAKINFEKAVKLNPSFEQYRAFYQ